MSLRTWLLISSLFVVPAVSWADVAQEAELQTTDQIEQQLEQVATAVEEALEVVPYSREQAMTIAQLNGIDIAYTQAGPADGTPVLLIMGLTGSHRLWGEDFVNGLVDQGFRVILFDNRDTGESARLDNLGTPTLWWEIVKNMIGLDVNAPYSLADMAADGIAVLDELNVSEAHIVGASMGGMIAQIIAAQYPERTSSLVSIMSTTGAPHLPEATDDAQQSMMDLGSADEEEMTRQLHDMGIHPEAMPRQLMAIVAAGDRSEQVKTIGVRTLVQHGADDPLLPPEHGQHTAELIGGSRYVEYPNMAHDMPAEVVPALIGDIVNHFRPQ